MKHVELSRYRGCADVIAANMTTEDQHGSGCASVIVDIQEEPRL
jgi:hypothetical protein